ncbi:DUF805 domain-containing protein [Bartonella sp. HY329]|uniref:DUF805 domain-containing protein n=1 Tax=unclassified Bartonella TaxID=2645622 RepID=UPI0021C7277D|nr:MULTISPECIES: DUF805 domain-containing protein [unclassified Bartonella]UXM95992.1 DUF805 domain-containing protein [Bartonella sp. HY329]UXN10317.1 DUF805 domain-containing protein [Bartonella sp. HY328]
MGFWQTVKTVIFKKYFKFSGRASRSEFWWFMLFYTICYMLIFALQSTIIVLIDQSINKTGYSFITEDIYEYLDIGFILCDVLFLLVFFFPRLGVTVRRLHDLNLSGWWSVLLVGLALTTLIPLLRFYFMDVYLYLINIGSNVFWFKFVFSLLVFVLLIVLIKKGTNGPNKYGENPVKVDVDVSIFS